MIKTKLKVVLILIFTSLQVLGQHSRENTPNIVPPTPQSYAMVRYGNMPLNEYEGMAQISIPIAEIKDRNIQNSISLNYSKIGVKVADHSNNAGINWVLQMGGVITRTVYDLPDEFSSRLIFDHYSEAQNIADAEDGTNEALLLNSYHLNPSYDNEIDVFEFSVNGLSGKFYLDKNLNPVLLSKNNPVKIETVGAFNVTHQFIITAIDGTKYYFGGENAIENTSKRAIMLYSNNVTSFYLTKIKGVDENEINFTYHHYGPRTIWLSQNERMSVLQKAQLCGMGENGSDAYESYSYDNDVLRVKNAISLIAITGTEKTIKLNYDYSANNTGEKITSVEIVNNINNKKIQEIDFEFLNQYRTDDPNTIDRYFLTKIKKYNFDYNNNKIFDVDYSFDYNSPSSLPNRNSYSVDAFGYFNGKYNTTLLPDLKLLHNFDTSKYVQYNYADRRSDFDFAIMGTLASITYPTKGSTIFEYEGLDHTEQYVNYENLDVYSNDYSATLQDSISIDASKVIDNKIKGRFFITQNEITSVTSRIEVNLLILNELTNQVVEERKMMFLRVSQEELEARERTKYQDFTFETVQTEKYKFILTLTEKENINYSGQVYITYNTEKVKKANIGLRLKKSYEKDENGNITNIKRLYYSSYKDINNITPPSAFSLYPRGYLNNTYNAQHCFPGGTIGNPFPVGTYTMEQLIMSSSPNRSMAWENYSKPFVYSNVTVSYGGDNFEKGGEEKSFITEEKESEIILKLPDVDSPLFLGLNVSSMTNAIITDSHRTFLFDGFNGKPLKVKQFLRQGNDLLLKSKSTFTYQSQIQDTVYDLMVRSVYDLLTLPAGYQTNSIVSNLYVAYSPLPSYNIALLTKTENFYYENIPADMDDDTPYKKLKIVTNYSYNNPMHNQLTSQKVTFPDLSTQEIKYEYAHEKNNQKLVEGNMVGIPLETTTFKNNVALSKVETIYPDQNNFPTTQAGNLLLPLSVKSTLLPTISTLIPPMGEVKETEVTYNFYDDEGNLLQYTTKAGTPTAIIWGYNQTQPIAKIEGAKLSDIPQGLITAIVNASDYSSPFYSEATLLTQLDIFTTSFPNYQVSTYTYKPLIGVTTITPPNGIREIYKYDTANRLQSVVDIDGKILKEYKYNYKP